MTHSPEPRPVTDASGHAPVLLEQVTRLLEPRAGQTVADLTAGRGGHAQALAHAVGPTGVVVLVDLDPENLAFAESRTAAEGCKIDAIHGTFADIERIIAQHGHRADAVLADLGFASNQMDDPARGLSFLRDGPLDMRMNPTGAESAADVLARLTERDLADAIFQLGEDPFARRIARAIVQRREREPIRTTQVLADTVRAAYGARAHQSRMHPATRTFMALRILVNDELGALQTLLASVERGARAAHAQTPTWLQPGARVAIISFHSLEDRLVKHTFAGLERSGVAERLTRKPLEALPDEVASNSRARSAKLRAIRLV